MQKIAKKSLNYFTLFLIIFLPLFDGEFLGEFESQINDLDTELSKLVDVPIDSIKKNVEQIRKMKTKFDAINAEKNYCEKNFKSTIINKIFPDNHRNIDFKKLKYLAKKQAKILLFSVHSNSNVKPYNIYIDASKGSSKIIPIDRDTGNEKLYKSILVHYAKQIFKTITLEVFHKGQNKIVAFFKFKIPNTKFLIGNLHDWFNKKNLIDAWPYKLQNLKAKSYNFFSIFGLSDAYAIRRFYMNFAFGGCPIDTGVFSVTEKPHCDWENRNFKTSPAILYVDHNASPNLNWQKHTLVAKRFRFVGELRKF